LDILEVTENDFKKPLKGYKSHTTMRTMSGLRGTGDLVAVSRKGARVKAAPPVRTTVKTAEKKAPAKKAASRTRKRST
jgi:hypothetical protein